MAIRFFIRDILFLYRVDQFESKIKKYLKETEYISHGKSFIDVDAYL